MQCERDWFEKFGEQAVNHFGRIVEPIKLTEENAWVKLDRYYGDGSPFYWYNRLTEQELPLTEEQFNNPSLVRP